MDEKSNVIELPQKTPSPLPSQYPFGTPSPEDALIEIIDREKSNEEEAK